MSPPLSVLRHIVTEAKRHFGQAMAAYVDARIQPAHSSIIQQRAATCRTLGQAYDAALGQLADALGADPEARVEHQHIRHLQGMVQRELDLVRDGS